MPTIVQTDDVLGGKSRIEGRRISVFQIGQMYLEGGYATEDIADQLDISLAEIHAALSYYYDHPDEMAAVRERRDALRESLNDTSNGAETLSS